MVQISEFFTQTFGHPTFNLFLLTVPPFMTFKRMSTETKTRRFHPYTFFKNISSWEMHVDSILPGFVVHFYFFVLKIPKKCIYLESTWILSSLVLYPRPLPRPICCTILYEIRPLNSRNTVCEVTKFLFLLHFNNN